jgi:Domain of unknown function (DUF932)
MTATKAPAISIKTDSNGNIIPLTMEDARKAAPAAFATTQGPNIKSKAYNFTSSEEIIGHMSDLGFSLVSARQSKSRVQLHQEFGTHTLAFMKDGLYVSDNNGGIEARPTITLINNHSGIYPVQFTSGLFRQVCSNGLCVSEKDFGGFRERHTKYTAQQVKELVDERIDGMGTIVKNINIWSGREMSSAERFAFATESLALRIGNDRKPEQYEIAGVLEAHRKEDEGNDLWHVFNRVQENIINGGFDLANRKARAIRNPMADLNVNMKLWAIAEQYSN